MRYGSFLDRESYRPELVLPHVKTLFLGHPHDGLNSADRGHLGFEAFGVGFSGISDLAGQDLRPGEFDAARHPVPLMMIPDTVR